MIAAVVFGAVLTIPSIAAKNNLTAPASPINVNSIATAWFRAIAERNESPAGRAECACWGRGIGSAANRQAAA